MCPQHGPGHDMNSCKVIQKQAKYMKAKWSTANGGGEGYMRFQVDKKRMAKGIVLNDLVASVVKYTLKKQACKR